MADAMADKHGVPRRMFTNLIRQESGFNPNARSYKGAIGLTQLMPATVKALGQEPETVGAFLRAMLKPIYKPVKINPYDPIDNLKGGAVYLARQLDVYGGSCRKAAAAFNGGPRAVPYLERTGWRYDPTAPRHAWSNQTAEYVMKVCEGV